MSESSAITRVLIILMGSLGDVARGLSLLRAIKTAKPHCSVTWLVEPACHELVRLHPDIDEVILFERQRGIAGFLSLYQCLRSKHFEIALDLQRHAKSGFFSRISGAKCRIGFNRADSKEGNWLFQTEYIEARGRSASKLQHYWAFLDKLAIPVPKVPDFGLRVSVASISSPLPESLARPYCVLVLGSRWESKDWPLTGYLELSMQLLRASAVSVVLVGTGQHEQSAKLIETKLGSKRVFNLVGKTSISKLARVLLDARAVVGPDSGPGHLAGALGVPYVSLFGPTLPKRTAPFGSEHLVVRADLGCSPCYRRTCPGLDKLCMRLISPEAVFNRLEPLINKS